MRIPRYEVLSTKSGSRIRGSRVQCSRRTDHLRPRLHKAINLLAAPAPNVHEALAAANAAGVTHVNLDGTLIHTDRVAQRGPHGADLWWSGKRKDHGGNVQVPSYPDSFPCFVSEVRPGREHDTTCAK